MAEHNRFDDLAGKLLDNTPKQPDADMPSIWYDPDNHPYDVAPGEFDRIRG
ncbi:hypothetical protein [Bifidobacterium psychraerophilum]|uniref:hypothetical protein n=1 Tax=Bifidobacterium psychraerophilum TaxID=218140 RepID=UPI0023F3C322|nr:hypothetical protein [Bifidobacterium psychraerophilum]MCI1659549.1 hypothetical protein [Bifidobacterium psychraerophilum]MCI1804483.1 hypothetical protein [Bifidobacterium psychraerophilum]MCI2176360.1 hypothetical protein [Bifidobacterium psychraerophilum]